MKNNIAAGLAVSPHILKRLMERDMGAVSYTHLRAHETDSYLVCRLLLEKKTSNPTHIQGAFICDEEVEAVVSYVKEQCIQQDDIVYDETKIDL